MALAALVSIVLAMAVGAQEDPASMVSAEEVVSERAAGPWQGHWTLTREDPRLFARGAQELLGLQVIQDQGAATASVQWLAHRAICIDPFDAPCEWVGAAGEVTGIVAAGGLYAVLPISADPDDPLVLHLMPDGRGLLFSRDGRLHYALEHRRAAD
jgi:hypothetical protein